MRPHAQFFEGVWQAQGLLVADDCSDGGVVVEPDFRDAVLPLKRDIAQRPLDRYLITRRLLYANVHMFWTYK